MWVTLYAVGYLALEITAIYFAYRAISHARTPQGSLAWAFFLIMVPWLAVPAFAVFGHVRYRGYVISRRDSAQVIADLDAMGEHYRARQDGGGFGYRAFEEIAEMPVVSGNSMEILVDGDAAFEAIFEAFDSARDYILAQFYIVHDDELGRAFAGKLKAAAARGVTVRLLYDSVGSAGIPRSYLDDLRAAGVEVVNANAMRGPSHRFQINFRNHRKIVVVDGKVGFIGGLNVGDEYLGKDPRFGHWRDTHVRVRGPAVTQLQLVVSEDWHWATQRLPLEHMIWETDPAPEGMDAVVVATGPGDVLETGSLYFCACITRATRRLWIATPYFVPDVDILTALKLAALRGVDVRILVPDMIDHRMPWLAAFAYFDEVRQAGVQIWRYTNGFMHQKVVVVDDSIASIGSTNMDNRSCRLNFEATVVVFDERAAASAAEMLEADFANAYLLDRTLAEQPASRRIGAPFARLLAPVL